MTLFLGILVGIAVLGLMVIVHEWGHYVAARFFGVRVLTFSVGFGTRLFGIKRGTTDFCVRAIPLGGYVKMAGENIFEDREGTPDEFYSKPRWQRSIIAFAGPFVNIAFAVILLAGLYLFHFEIPEYANEVPEIAAIRPESPAEKAGLQKGDIILSVGGDSTADWESVIARVLLTANESLEVRAQRGDEEILTQLVPNPRGDDGDVYVGWDQPTGVMIYSVTVGMPADEAGLKPGDEILEIDGAPVTSMGIWTLTELIKGTEGEPFELTFNRGGNTSKVTLRTELMDLEDGPTYLIGIRPGPKSEVVQLGVADAFQQSLLTNLRFIRIMGRLARRLFTGRSDLSSLQGPIGITVIAGQVARLGLGPLVGLMALISMNLGVLNLLPIPILDGGHIATFAVEGLLRRDLSLRLKERFMQLGFFALMMLFAVVMYNDVVRYFFR